jgi:hypothetical protein
MRIVNNIEEVRGSVNIFVSDRIGVITLTEHIKGLAYYGVQFWRPQMIDRGFSINTDGTESKFVELLNN